MNETSANKEEKEKAKVMIVGDNLEAAESIRDHLILENFEVMICNKSSRTFQTLVELKKGIYHLVLLDLRMPKISEEKMLRKMREQGWNIPIIILTTYPSIKSAIESLRSETFDYVKKPFKVSGVVETIKSAIKEREITIHPKKILMSEVGQRMRFLRQEKKLTLKQLATRVGVSPSLICKIEVGSSSPSLFTIYKVAQSLQINLRDFFEDIEV